MSQRQISEILLLKISYNLTGIDIINIRFINFSFFDEMNRCFSKLHFNEICSW